MNTITLMRRDVSNCHHWRWQSFGENVDEALKIFFEFLPYVDLCKCASVSKTWRKIALDELQSRCTIQVKSDDEIRFVLQQLQTRSNFRVGKCIVATSFIDELLLKQMLMKVKITLNVLILETSSIKTQDAVLLKLLSILPNLSHLSITLNFASSSEADIHDESSLKKRNASFPVLSGHYWAIPFSRVSEECAQPLGSNGSSTTECNANNNTSRSNVENSVCVHQNVRYLHFDIGENGRFQLSKIFHAFPNLVELSVTNVIDEPRKQLKCQQGDSPHRFLGLKHFTVRQYSNIGFPEKMVRTLMKLGMCLEKLMLIFHPPTQSSNNTLQASSALLKQFIESQRASLKSLKLIQVEDDVWKNTCNWNKSNNSRVTSAHVAYDYQWNYNYTSPSISLFPISLPNLEILHVQKPLITNLAQVLKHFPKLKQLSIQVSPHGANWKGMFPQKLEPHTAIHTFKLDFIDPDSFSRLSYCFPSLQILQLAYCDESLLNVFCKQIPYFNGVAAKETLVPCQQCHGTGIEKFSLYSNQLGNNKDAGTVEATLNKGICNEHEQNRGSLQQQQQQQVGNQLSPSSRTLIPFKNLKLLRVRSCHHSPYENFVFLQNGRPAQTLTDIEGHDFGHSATDCDDFDSSVGFSWNMADIMKDKKFVDLPVNYSENAESCSSA